MRKQRERQANRVFAMAAVAILAVLLGARLWWRLRRPAPQPPARGA